MNIYLLTAFVICNIAAVCKLYDPKFTFGGEFYRTRLWSSLFFVVLALLIFLGSKEKI